MNVPLAIGYYLGMAYAKMQEQKKKTRENRGVDTKEDQQERQKKSKFFLNKQNRRNKEELREVTVTS